MDDDIYNMIAGNRQSVYPVVEGKGEIADIAVYEGTVKLKTFCIRRAREIMEVFYYWIINNKVTLIPLKRSIEGVGVDDEDEKSET